MHGNDFSANSLINYSSVTCAIPFERLVHMLKVCGLGAPSTNDHYGMKEELEPILANMSECSMAEAHEENLAKGETNYLSLDGGHASNRHAAGCTMPAHGPSGKIIEMVHARLTDEGATSSQKLEPLCYGKLLGKPRVQVYKTSVFDGSRELV